jgi:hypothetical protein
MSDQPILSTEGVWLAMDVVSWLSAEGFDQAQFTSEAGDIDFSFNWPGGGVEVCTPIDEFEEMSKAEAISSLMGIYRECHASGDQAEKGL